MCLNYVVVEVSTFQLTRPNLVSWLYDHTFACNEFNEFNYPTESSVVVYVFVHLIIIIFTFIVIWIVHFRALKLVITYSACVAEPNILYAYCRLKIQVSEEEALTRIWTLGYNNRNLVVCILFLIVIFDCCVHDSIV